MPTYEYECKDGHLIEQILSYEDGPDGPPKTIRCPCGSWGATLKISAPAVIFKGSGFYSTDNRPGIDTQTED